MYTPLYTLYTLFVYILLLLFTFVWGYGKTSLLLLCRTPSVKDQTLAWTKNNPLKYSIITVYNAVILIRNFIKFLDRNFLFIEKVQAFLDLIFCRTLAIGTKYNLKRRENRVIGNFMKRLCACLLFQWLFLDQIRFKTKQKLKYKVDFNFIFIAIEKYILEVSYFFFWENSGTNQNFIEHVL